jgi:hypothetical protein
MARIRLTLRVERPVQVVYAFLTTPGTWPAWHPGWLRVSGTVGRPLLAGDVVTVEILPIGSLGRVRWTVHEAVPPRRWAIGACVMGVAVTIRYILRPAGDATILERELSYRPPGPALRLVDRLVLRPVHRRVAMAALCRLRRGLTCG